MTTISSALPIYNTDASAGSAAVVSVSKTSDPGLSQIAVSLASDASVVATLDASSSSASATYSAAGLLNSFVQAGNSASTDTSTDPSQPSTDTDSKTAQQSLDQAIVGSLSSSPSTSGIYTSSGALQTLPSTDVTSNWASILKTNPELATTAVADSMNQGIVATLSTSA